MNSVFRLGLVTLQLFFLGSLAIHLQASDRCDLSLELLLRPEVSAVYEGDRIIYSQLSRKLFAESPSVKSLASFLRDQRRAAIPGHSDDLFLDFTLALREYQPTMRGYVEWLHEIQRTSAAKRTDIFKHAEKIRPLFFRVPALPVEEGEGVQTREPSKLSLADFDSGFQILSRIAKRVRSDFNRMLLLSRSSKKLTVAQATEIMREQRNMVYQILKFAREAYPNFQMMMKLQQLAAMDVRYDFPADFTVITSRDRALMASLKMEQAVRPSVLRALDHFIALKDIPVERDYFNPLVDMASAH